MRIEEIRHRIKDLAEQIKTNQELLAFWQSKLEMSLKAETVEKNFDSYRLINLFNDLTTFFRTLYKEDYLILEPDFSNIPELKENEQDKHTRYMQDIEHGILTPAEVRVLKGYDKTNIPELNKFYLSSSLKPIDTIDTENQ